jgi:hypothetical protein
MLFPGQPRLATLSDLRRRGIRESGYDMTDKLTVVVTKAANQREDLVQILSDDMLINVTLIADEIELTDEREDP